MTISKRSDSPWSENNTWYVGGTNPITVTAPSGLAQDDFLLAIGRQNNSANVTDLVSNGWTVLYESSGAGNSYFLAYQIMGASPPADFDFTTDTTASGNDAWVHLIAYDVVSTTDPFDITFVSADHLIQANPTSTTHATPDVSSRSVNAWVLSIIMTNEVTGGPNDWTPPTGYTLDAKDGNANAPGGAVAHKALTAPADEDPGDWTLDVTSAANLITLVLRDADSTYIEIPDVTWEPQTGYSHVEYRGDVIPEESILHMHRGTHTGTSGSSTLTDSGKSLAADEWEDYEVFNFTDGSTGVIGTHSAGTGPHTLSTALTGGNDNDFDNGDSYDIRVPMVAGDQIGYETASTSTAGIYSFDYYLLDATDGSVSAEATASCTASGLPSGSTGTIDVFNDGQAIFNITGAAAGGGSGVSAILGESVFGANILGDISSPASGPSAAITGTITTASEADIRAGGETIIITLTDDTWVAAGTTFDAQRQNIIDGLDAATSPTNGWNNEVRDKMSVSEVVRTSDTVVTITLLAQAAYDVSAQETITATIPSSALVTSGSPVVASPSFNITIVPYATLSGTGINVDWTVIRDSGGTIVVTLTDDTFIAAGTGPIGTTAQSDAFVQSFTAATSPTDGWNNEISLDNTDLVRTSNTVATITIPATALYDPQQKEIITGTVQAAILTTYGTDISAGSFSINFSSGAEGPLSKGLSRGLSAALSN